MSQSTILADLHPVIVIANVRIDIQWFTIAKCEVPCPVRLRPCPERHDRVPRGTTVSREVRFGIRDSGGNPMILSAIQNIVFGTVQMSLGLLWIAV